MNMKYRIIKEHEKFRAYIAKQNNYGVTQWTAIENDRCECTCCWRTVYYDTKEDAVEACIEHHETQGYLKKEDIVEEFEL